MKYSYNEVVWSITDKGKTDSLYRVIDYKDGVYTLSSIYYKNIIFLTEDRIKKDEFDVYNLFNIDSMYDDLDSLY